MANRPHRAYSKRHGSHAHRRRPDHFAQEIREQLHLSPGDQVKIFVDGHGRVIILPVLPISSLRGILKGRRDSVLTTEEMDEAIAAEVTDRYRRSFDNE